LTYVRSTTLIEVGTYHAKASRPFSVRCGQQIGNRIVLDKWVPYRSDKTAVDWRVFGFPHAAGSAAFYRSWRDHAPAGIDFCPIELPGHGGRMDEMPLTNLAALMINLQAVLQPLLTMPFAFFGHSTGACIAFEAARMLRAADGRSAAHLFVSGRAAPGHAIEERSSQSPSDDELLALLSRHGGTPALVMERAELMAAVLPTLRADLALAESRRLAAGARLPCPVTVFGGAHDAIDGAALRAWSNVTTGTFRVRMFPGGHFYLAEAAEALVGEIVGALRRPESLLAWQSAGVEA
jgi:medium-chain acyl-[acyl-carrier-protein] hydrolase